MNGHVVILAICLEQTFPRIYSIYWHGCHIVFVFPENISKVSSLTMSICFQKIFLRFLAFLDF